MRNAAGLFGSPAAHFCNYKELRKILRKSIENRFEITPSKMWVFHQNQQGQGTSEVLTFAQHFQKPYRMNAPSNPKRISNFLVAPGRGNASCYGEDFFFKYSSIINACGNGGKPIETPQ